MAKYSEEARRLWPYLLPFVERVSGIGNTGGTSGSVGVGGAPSPHALDGVHHIGTITNAQGPNFLLSDGTRDLTGNLAVTAGITIDGVDLSAHVADPDAHHDTATAGNTAISLTGQAISVALNGTSGLSISSGLRVGAGDGIDVLTATVAVDVTDIINTSYGLYEPTANDIGINIVGNTGLTFNTGVLSLGTPSAVSVSSTSTVTTTTHTHDVTTSSDVSAGAESILASTSAGGLGLASMFTTGAVDVGQGFTAGASGFRVIYHTHDYDHTHVVVNPTGGWTLDEQFGLDVDDNLLVRGWIVGKHAIQIEGAKMLLHFDGPAPFETNFQGNPTGHMGQKATMAGGVLFRPGKFGKAIQIAHGTTNYIKNPSFESSASNSWELASDNGTATRALDATKSVYGTYSLRLNRVVAENYAFIASDNQGTTRTVFNGVTVVLSGYVWVDVGSVTLSIHNSTGGATLASVTTSTTGEWQHISASYTNSTGSNVLTHVRVQFATAAGDVWVDAIQLEEGYQTPYLDGSLASGETSAGTALLGGYSWSSTAHNSISTRTAASLSYALGDNLSHEEGTLMMWVYPYATTGSATQYVFFALDGTSRIAIYIKASTGNWVIRIGGGTELDTGVTATLQEWTHIALTWDGTTAKIWINGGPGTIGSPPSHFVVYSGFTAIGSALYVGTSNTGSDIFNGLIDEISMVDRAMTGAEIVAIYNSNAPVFAEAATFHWRAGRNRIYADSEGLWGYGASGTAILGLYAGDDGNPSATKSWGGATLSEGDLLLGYYGAARGGWMLFDQDLVGGLPAWRFGYADKEVLRLDSGGASLNGVLDIDTTGGIYQGTGTFASPTTGLKIWNSSGIGRIAGYNSGTAQWYADTDGRLYAGGGNVIMDEAGITVEVGSTPISEGDEFASPNSYSLITSGGIRVGALSGAGTGHVALAAAPSTGESQLYLMANALDVVWGAGAVWPQITMDAGTVAGSVMTLDAQDINIGHSTVNPTDVTIGGTLRLDVTSSAAALGAYAGKITVNINGTTRYIPYYAS